VVGVQYDMRVVGSPLHVAAFHGVKEITMTVIPQSSEYTPSGDLQVSIIISR
jgi:hypothetical protein